MTRVEQLLTQYAAYHRDRRNIATHLLGIPLIIFAVVLAAALVSFPVGGLVVTAAAVAAVAASAYWIALDRALGLALAAVLFLMCALASEITARLPEGGTLALAGFLFAGGWALQFWGHRFEGVKSAFLDDARQLAIGPLFVCAEVFFFLGAKPQLRRRIEERAGPTVARRDGAPVSQFR